MAGIGSATALPRDVLHHFIFKQLSPSSLVAVSMVCKLWHNTVLQIRRPRPSEVLISLFAEGESIPYFTWFEQTLAYNFPTKTHKKSECLEVALQGI